MMHMRACVALVATVMCAQAEVWQGVSYALDYDGVRTGATDTCTLTIERDDKGEPVEMRVRAWAKRSGLPGIVGDFPVGELMTIVIKEGDDNSESKKEDKLSFSRIPSLEYGLFKYSRIAYEKIVPVSEGSWIEKLGASLKIARDEKYIVMSERDRKVYAVEQAEITDLIELARVEWECEQIVKL
eukprot:TRINITY_DN19859_c0_g1_i1.p1 TRINITY_DN19859_c0_g1~~TRINITY_DN19859_c0_g1_i1.p1  ORF type:complete len:198 (+),score=73.33 TRINITY_DN19859_c0_g1_i1:40-594(+)